MAFIQWLARLLGHDVVFVGPTSHTLSVETPTIKVDGEPVRIVFAPIRTTDSICVEVRNGRMELSDIRNLKPQPQ